MPLDGKITDFVKPVAPDLSKPSLEALAWVLESGRLPAGWTWDYSKIYERNECGTAGCALGIVAAMWVPDRLFFDREDAFQLFGIGFAASEAVFANGTDDLRITPAVVAGRIRDYLDGRPIRYLVEGDRS